MSISNQFNDDLLREREEKKHSERWRAREREQETDIENDQEILVQSIYFKTFHQIEIDCEIYCNWKRTLITARLWVILLRCDPFQTKYYFSLSQSVYSLEKSERFTWKMRLCCVFFFLSSFELLEMYDIIAAISIDNWICTTFCPCYKYCWKCSLIKLNEMVKRFSSSVEKLYQNGSFSTWTFFLSAIWFPSINGKC